MRELIWIPVSCMLIVLVYMLAMCRSKRALLLSSAVFVLSSLLTLIFLVSDQFTGVGINEAVFFHLIYGLEGLHPFQFPWQLFSVIASLLLIVVAIVAAVKSLRWKSNRPARHRFVLVEWTLLAALSFFAVVVHPAALQIAEISEEFFDSQRASLLDAELRSIGSMAPTSRKPKSLVYIYAESLERTFLHDEIFPGLAPNLKSLEKSSLSIRGIRQAPLTDWTIAGMVASQCGMPLATFNVNRNDFSDVQRFIPGATCMGDLLKAAGWKTVYMGGADLGFAGKGRFYRDHGFDEIWGLEELKKQFGSAPPVSKWGLYDDMLFEAAFKKFQQLSSSDQPFALVLLTLDTHPPSGHRTPACNSGPVYGDGKVPMLNAVNCDDRLITEFVEKLEAEGREDLVIVIASDHFQMRNDVAPVLEANAKRRENLFLVRSPEITPAVVRREATTLDIAPTVFSLLGWDMHAMALGRNLMGKEQTLLEKYGESEFFGMVQNWRMSLWSTWQEKPGHDDVAHGQQQAQAMREK